MQHSSPFAIEHLPDARLELIRELASIDGAMDRAMGCMVGMAVGDAVGAPLEFLNVADPGQSQSAYSLETHSYTMPFNKFGLSPGQWTDDCAMGLCLADSLLASGRLVQLYGIGVLSFFLVFPKMTGEFWSPPHLAWFY